VLTRAAKLNGNGHDPPSEIAADDDLDADAEPSGDACLARTEGQRLLLAVSGSLQQIGSSIGATKQAVALWRTGARTPEERWRRKLYAVHRIPLDAWDRVPNSAPAVEWFPDTEGREPSALEDCTRLLALLRSQLNRPDLLARERTQLGDAFARALAQKERLEKAREMTETRTIREHPEWKRLKRLIIEALLLYPEAARAVETAIMTVLGEEAPELVH
jgi:hypothetical protein